MKGTPMSRHDYDDGDDYDADDFGRIAAVMLERASETPDVRRVMRAA